VARLNEEVVRRCAVANPVMSDPERIVDLTHALVTVLDEGVPGDVVELGCNRGRTSVVLQMVMEASDPGRTLHLYDSFEGLPEPSSRDGRDGVFVLGRGDCLAAECEVRTLFHQHGLRTPVIHAGWFSDTLPHDLPEQIAFAYLDADLYESTLIALRHVYPRLSEGALVVLDDYADTERPTSWSGLPGPRAACEHFFALRPERTLAIISRGAVTLAAVKRRKGARSSPPRRFPPA
jgi:O-methyltransferase